MTASTRKYLALILLLIAIITLTVVFRDQIRRFLPAQLVGNVLTIDVNLPVWSLSEMRRHAVSTRVRVLNEQGQLLYDAIVQTDASDGLLRIAQSDAAALITQLSDPTPVFSVFIKPSGHTQVRVAQDSNLLADTLTAGWPCPGDFNGDGRVDLAEVRSAGVDELRKSSTEIAAAFGTREDGKNQLNLRVVMQVLQSFVTGCQDQVFSIESSSNSSSLYSSASASNSSSSSASDSSASASENSSASNSVDASSAQNSSSADLGSSESASSTDSSAGVE